MSAYTLAACVAFILVPLVFPGCRPSAPAPVHFPITRGFHDALPERGTRIAVEGTNPLAVDHVMRWLRDHGYEAVPANPTDPMTSSFLVTVTTTMESAIREGVTPDVNIQGVETGTGTIRLRGRAYMPIDSAADVLIPDLVCQAMATAWGYRLPGQLEIPSALMCRVGTVTRGGTNGVQSFSSPSCGAPQSRVDSSHMLLCRSEARHVDGLAPLSPSPRCSNISRARLL